MKTIEKSGIFTRRSAIMASVAAAGMIAMTPMVAHADNTSVKVNDFLTRLNKNRVSKGYQKLSLDSNISKVSQEISQRMAKIDDFDNDMGYASDSRVPSGWVDTIQIVARSGYDNGASIYNLMIEGSNAKHLLAKNYNTVGIGIATSSSGYAYVTVSLFEYKKNSTTPPAPKQTFTDVPADLIFHDEIERLAALGITNGWTMKNGTKQYRPLENVKRDAMIVFIYRAMKVRNYTPPKKSPFADVKTNNIFYKEIAWAYEAGISTGWKMRNGTRQFRPLENVKRDAVAAFLMRASGEKAPKITRAPFSDVSTKTIFAPEIAWMKQTGISTGWKHNNTYQPLSNTKRDAMAAFMIRWMDYMGL